MFVIVEGPDNSGKSTLVNQLSKDLKLLVINNRKLPASVAESQAYLDLVLPLTKHFPTIFDRWQTISEPIYGPICRKNHLFKLAQIDFQFEVIRPLRPMVIYCRPPSQVALNFGPIEQMEGVISNAEQLLKAYDDHMIYINNFWAPVVRYDWTAGGYEELRHKISQHYQGKK